MTVILYAVPVFFLLIAIELVFEKIRGTNYYRVNDAINSLSAGVLSRMMDIMHQLLPFTLYALVYQHFSATQLDNSPLIWLLAFVLYDFLYYWNHRLGHEISLLWAAHVVHHSSEEYNLTTALRQTSGSLLSWVFYLPMALLGFEPGMVITVAALNLVYQFWVHTRHIAKLGWFEWCFVTPSNHRVHHAQNACYIDKNYGGVFIIWDRLFATFQQEKDDEPPIFGIRKALHSWNPVWANLQVYAQLLKDSWHTKKWQDKLRVWLGRTGWRPLDVSVSHPIAKADLAQFSKFDLPLAAATRCYALLQHGITILVALNLMMYRESLALGSQLQIVAFVVFSSVTLGWLMERRTLALWLELAKNLLCLGLSMTLAMPSWMQASLVTGCLASLLMSWWVWRDLRHSEHQESLLINQN